jgi:hypothetical protein
MIEPSVGSPSEGITISFTRQQTLEGSLSESMCRLIWEAAE